MAIQERAVRTRERVLDAAAEEFAVYGYAEATLKAVALRTGMTKGALYGHFASKEHLAEALVARSAEIWQTIPSTGEEEVTAADEWRVAALERFGSELVRRLGTDVRLRAVLRLAVDRPALVRIPLDVPEALRQHLVTLVERARRGGAPCRVPPEMAAELLLLAVHGAVQMSWQEPHDALVPRWEAAWRALVTLLVREPGEPC
ncbi:TetR family transcriptional regulator [Streptomyces sp. NPDC054863]